ncbi:MAG TPA: hydrolase, partial [Bacteroidales bacterium]|nr:hydrolase [Bacteroidales bacterium]
DESCHLFDPAQWHNKSHKWINKLFIKESIPQVFHIPLPGTYKRSVVRLWNKAKAAHATPDLKDYLLLAYDPTPWKSDLYMLVTSEVSEANNVRFSGSFYSKVFDGSLNHIPQYIKQMDVELARDEKMAVKYYFYFATCPDCAKKYGHNYIVAFAEV